MPRALSYPTSLKAYGPKGSPLTPALDSATPAQWIFRRPERAIARVVEAY